MKINFYKYSGKRRHLFDSVDLTEGNSLDCLSNSYDGLEYEIIKSGKRIKTGFWFKDEVSIFLKKYCE